MNMRFRIIKVVNLYIVVIALILRYFTEFASFGADYV